MAVYSYAQLMELWIKAGGSTATAALAAAIAEAESGGNSDAYNGHDTNGQGGTQVSAGLWQISNGTMTPIPNWSNPAANAAAAVGKWKAAGGFSPWGTYDSGAYKAFLSPGTSPDPNVPGSPTQQASLTAQQASIDCLVGNPFTVSAFGFSASAGPTCLFTKSNARAFIGAGLLAAGGLLAFDGGLFLMGGLALRAAGMIGAIPGGRAAQKAAGGLFKGGSDQAPPGATADWVPQKLRPPRAGDPVSGPKAEPGSVVTDTAAA